MSSLLNLIWFIFFWWPQALFFLLLGALFYVTVIGIPIGSSLFQLAKLLAFPFGKALVKDADRGGTAKTWHLLLNILWFPFGLILTVMAFAAAIPLFIMIITIPVAIVYVRVGKFALSPFGLRVVSKEEAIAQRTAEIMMRAQAGNARPADPTPLWTAGPSTEMPVSEGQKEGNVPFRNDASASFQTSSAAPNEILDGLRNLKEMAEAQLTPERRERIGALAEDLKSQAASAYGKARAFQKSKISDLRLYAILWTAAAVCATAFTAYSFLVEKTYYDGKDVMIVDDKAFPLAAGIKPPLNGKVIVKKDGDLVLDYAKVVDDRVAYRFKFYPNGKPMFESHATFDATKDSKSEYVKEWYENGKPKTYDRFDKLETWYENGTKKLEREKYLWYLEVESGRALVGTTRKWAEDGKITSETIFEGRTLSSEITYAYRANRTLETKTIRDSKTGTNVYESYYESGKIKSRGSGLVKETWYENGQPESVTNAKSGTGITFYDTGKRKEYSETETYLKKGYFPDGTTVRYEYVGQVGKTYDVNKAVVEECKKGKAKKKRNESSCFLVFCTNNVVEYEADVVQCFDKDGKFLYEAPSSGWKTVPELKTAATK